MKTRMFIAAMALTVFVLQGCETTTEPEASNDVSLSGSTFAKAVADDPQSPDFLKVGRFSICKVAPEDINATFSFDVTFGALVNHVIESGECKVVATATTNGVKDVTITELPKAGWEMDGNVFIYNIDEFGTVTSHFAGPGATIAGQFEKGKAGCVAVYKNKKIPTGGQGCTPGAWKQNLVRNGAWSATGYATDDLVKNVFTAATSPAFASTTLLQALSLQGGNSFDEKTEILLRAGTAALLNAAHPGVAYNLTPQGVKDAVNGAINSGDASQVTSVASQLDAWNNQGCGITGRAN